MGRTASAFEGTKPVVRMDRKVAEARGGRRRGCGGRLAVSEVSFPGVSGIVYPAEDQIRDEDEQRDTNNRTKNRCERDRCGIRF